MEAANISSKITLEKLCPCRDLKTSNILLSQEGVAKIGDVGLAKILSDVDQASMHMVAGTFAYAAPELILGWSCSDRVRALLRLLLKGAFVSQAEAQCMPSNNPCL